MHTLHRALLVETLLDALEAERHVRAPLLLTVIDELSACEPLAAAAPMAEQLLVALEKTAVADIEFVRHVRALRDAVRDLGKAPESGVRSRVVDARVPSWSSLEAAPATLGAA